MQTKHIKNPYHNKIISGIIDSEDTENSNSQKWDNNVYLIYNETSVLNNINYIIQYNQIFYQITSIQHNITFIAVSIYPEIDTPSLTLQYYRRNRLTTIPVVYLSQTNEEEIFFLCFQNVAPACSKRLVSTQPRAFPSPPV